MSKFKINERVVTVFIGNYEAMNLTEPVFRNYNEILICPRCLGAVHLGKSCKKGKWSYEKGEAIIHELDCNSEEEFYNHVKECPSVLKRGINKIDCDSKKQARTIACKFAKWSSLEARLSELLGRTDPQINEWSFIESKIKDRIVAYIYVDERRPVGYASFRIMNFNYEGKFFSSYVLLDLYTFPSFRNGGIATKLFEHAIKDLNIDPSHLPVLSPFTTDSIGILENICTGEVLEASKYGYSVIKKEDIQTEVNDFYKNRFN